MTHDYGAGSGSGCFLSVIKVILRATWAIGVFIRVIIVALMKTCMSLMQNLMTLMTLMKTLMSFINICMTLMKTLITRMILTKTLFNLTRRYSPLRALAYGRGFFGPSGFYAVFAYFMPFLVFNSNLSNF